MLEKLKREQNQVLLTKMLATMLVLILSLTNVFLLTMYIRTENESLAVEDVETTESTEPKAKDLTLNADIYQVDKFNVNNNKGVALQMGITIDSVDKTSMEAWKDWKVTEDTNVVLEFTPITLGNSETDTSVIKPSTIKIYKNGEEIENGYDSDSNQIRLTNVDIENLKENGEEYFRVTYIYPEEAYEKVTKGNEIYLLYNNEKNANGKYEDIVFKIEKLQKAEDKTTLQKNITKSISMKRIQIEEELQKYDIQNVTEIVNNYVSNIHTDGSFSSLTTDGANVEEYSYIFVPYIGKQQDLVQGIKISDQKTTLQNNEKKELELSSYYTSTSINKEQFINILGEDGKITITDEKGTELASITKDTTVNENKEFEITYTSKPKQITILTTKPVKEGYLEITNDKKIEKVSYTKEQIVEYDTIVTEQKVTTIYNEETLKEQILKFGDKVKLPKTNATIKVENKVDGNSAEGISTVGENKANITINLNNNLDNSDTYKNPKFIVKLPDYISSYEVEDKNIEIINGSEFTISKIDKAEKTITLTLTGTQEDTSKITETQILIKDITIKVDEITPSLEGTVGLVYQNENVTKYEESSVSNQVEYGINTVKLNTIVPSGVILTSKIENYNGEETKDRVVQLSTDTTKTISASLEVGKEVNPTIKHEIVNNNDAKYTEIKILGKIPTGTATAVINKITGIENATIYYTINANATNDITVEANAWKTAEETTDLSTVKAYLIVINELEAKQKIGYEYTFKTTPQSEQTIEEQFTIQYVLNEETVTKTSPKISLVAGKVVEDEQDKNNTDVKVSISSYNNYNGDGEKIKLGTEIEYYITIQNKSDKKIENISIKNIVSEYVNVLSNEKFTKINEREYKADNISISPDNNLTLKISVKVKEDLIEDKELLNKLTVQIGEKIYELEEKHYAICNNLTISHNTNVETGYIKENEEVLYRVNIQNPTELVQRNVKFICNIPKEFEGISYKYKVGTKIVEGKINNNSIIISEDIYPKEAFDITINMKVRETATINNVEIELTSDIEYEDEKIKTLPIQLIITKANDLPSIDIPTDDGKDENEDENEDENLKQTYEIRGTAWIDADNDGALQETEVKLKDTVVYLIDKQKANIAKTTTTDENGEYIFNELPKGEYIVVFRYDSSKYSLTAHKKDGIDTSISSKVVDSQIKENGQDVTVAVTDVITIEDSSMAYVNMGIVKKPEFDLNLQKYITKVTVKNAEGTKVYEYEKEKLTKTEIHAKNFVGSTVEIEYKIVVKNEGKVAGYAKKIIDYMPDGTSFSSEKNPNWYIGKDANLYTEMLKDTIIKSGEEKEIPLTLSIKLSDDMARNLVNTAEIYEAYNEQGIEDHDSIPGNTLEQDDDMSSVTSIVTIKTGQMAIYMVLTTTIILILGTGIYFINKKVLK